MTYAVLNINQKAHSFAAMDALHKHCVREEPIHLMPHVDHSKTALNKMYIEPFEDSITKSWKRRVIEKESLTGKKIKRRSSSVLAIMGYVSFSHDTKINVNKWAEASIDWLAKKFGGRENLLECSLHMDETTPHLHFIIIPLTEDGRLCAKDFINGPHSMKKMHSEYGKAMEPFGLKRGEKKSKARRSNIQQYYKSVENIAKNPVIFRNENEEDEEYIKRLEDKIKEYQYAFYNKNRELQRTDEIINARIAQAMGEYACGIELFDIIMANYDDDLDFTINRIKEYIKIEKSMPRKDLEKVLMALLERYDINQNIISSTKQEDKEFYEK